MSDGTKVQTEEKAGLVFLWHADRFCQEQPG